MNAIWRPTSANDLGIDGQIEMLEGSGPVSSGRILAVQVKSGASYFKSASEKHILFRPEPRHQRYWARIPLPVVLVLHSPNDGITIYSDVKSQLGSGGAIRIPVDATFDVQARDALMALAEHYHGEITAERIIPRLLKARLEVGNGRSISAVEFLIASTNLDAGYLELRMARLHTLIEVAQGGVGVSLGTDEYDWVLRCILLCWALRLCERLDEQFDYWWYDLRMVPDMAMALTGTGREVAEYVLEHAGECVEYQVLGELDADRARQRLQWLSERCQAASDHLDASDRMGEHDM